MRVLISAPVGRDAFLIAETLTAAGIEAEKCESTESLLSTLNEAAGAAILAEEALSESAIHRLVVWLSSQPPWSDMPLLVLTFGGGRNALSVRRAQELQVLGNVTLLERPLRPDTLLIAVRAALRARMRQYEMRRRQETLSRVNADLEQFAHSASHDLQEPLRNVAIYSELLSRRYSAALDAQGQEFLMLLRTSALRMESLVRDLLVYTQAAGIGDERPELIDANEPLAEALSNLREAISESGAEVVHSSLPSVKIGRVHLQQVFQNLIGNAIKYRGKESPSICIIAEKKDSHDLFSVKDNGIGIKPEYHEQIFAIFKRLHTYDRYSGTGMGLAICKRIIERYQGQIWVESEPGAGSTFRFTLPS